MVNLFTGRHALTREKGRSTGEFTFCSLLFYKKWGKYAGIGKVSWELGRREKKLFNGFAVSTQ